MRYANERGKCDHRYIGEGEVADVFPSVEQLLDDLERDFAKWGLTMKTIIGVARKGRRFGRAGRNWPLPVRARHQTLV